MNNITIQKDSSILEALKVIDKIGIGYITVINNEEQVLGVITDGDIRRGFIRGVKLEDSVNSIVNKEFYSVTIGGDINKFSFFRKKRVKAVPLVDKEGKLIKILDFSVVKSILPIDAVIMAGGLGSRLRPLTNKIPKPLLKVGGKEIISYNFDRLHQFGISNQFVTVNYLSEQLEQFCNGYNDEINFNIINETEFLGTAGALSLIENEKFENDTILLMNSDLLTNIDYEDFYKSFKEKDADIMVASIPYQVNLPYAIFDAEDNIVKAFKEKPNYTYYANAGIYLIRKELLSLIPKGEFFNATDLMDSVLNKSMNLVHYPIRQYWLDIGKHEDFEKAQKDIAHINW